MSCKNIMQRWVYSSCSEFLLMHSIRMRIWRTIPHKRRHFKILLGVLGNFLVIVAQVEECGGVVWVQLCCLRSKPVSYTMHTFWRELKRSSHMVTETPSSLGNSRPNRHSHSSTTSTRDRCYGHTLNTCTGNTLSSCIGHSANMYMWLSAYQNLTRRHEPCQTWHALVGTPKRLSDTRWTHVSATPWTRVQTPPRPWKNPLKNKNKTKCRTVTHKQRSPVKTVNLVWSHLQELCCAFWSVWPKVPIHLPVEFAKQKIKISTVFLTIDGLQDSEI